jgi:hypothetical protein
MNDSTQTPQQALASLVSLTQKYLLQEHGVQDRLMTDRETYLHFRNEAMSQKRQDEPAPKPPTRVSPAHAPRIAPAAPIVSALPAPPAPQPPQPQQVAVTAVSSPPSPKPPSPPAPPKMQYSPAIENIVPSPKPQELVVPEEIALEPMSAPANTDFASMRACVTKLFPHYSLTNEIPSDSEAKRLSCLWKQDPTHTAAVALFSLNPQKAEKDLLTRLSEAIHQRLAPSALCIASRIEETEKWLHLIAQNTALKLILITPSHLKAAPQLHRQYRNEGNHHFLGRVPLHFMEETERYIQDPQEKALLWQTLCNLLPPNKK